MSYIERAMGDVKPVLVMVTVEVAIAVVSILFKVIANDWMSLSVFIAQRSLFATSLIVPLAFIMERKSKPKITSGALAQSFLCGLFGSTLSQNLFVKAVALATASYATAMFNLVPGATFILAICFGSERLNIGTTTGKAKVFGTLLGIGGAMILTFYKSTEIHIRKMHVNVMHHIQPDHVPNSQILGSALAFGACLSHSMWLVIQARMSEKFPWPCTSAALMSVMASVQSVIFALCIERDWSQWKLGWNIRLFAALYTGTVGSGLVWVLSTWCLRLKGPLYASTFMPLFLLFVSIGGFLVLDERLYLGSIIGSLLIVSGLYIVLWGKGKELKSNEGLKLTKDPIEGEPLEVITTNHVNDKSGKIDSNDVKPPITTPFSFMTVNEYQSKEGKHQSGVKDVSRKGKEENEGDEIPLNIMDSKPSA